MKKFISYILVLMLGLLSTSTVMASEERLIATKEDIKALNEDLETLFKPVIYHDFNCFEPNGNHNSFGHSVARGLYLSNSNVLAPASSNPLGIDMNDCGYKSEASEMNKIFVKRFNSNPSGIKANDSFFYKDNSYYSIIEEDFEDSSIRRKVSSLDSIKLLPDGKYYITIDEYDKSDVDYYKTKYMIADLKNINAKRQWCLYAFSDKAINLETFLDISVKVNGKKIELSTNPYVEKGTTLIPISDIVRALDGKSSWDNSTRIATITQGKTEIEVQIDNKIAYINGKKIMLNQSPTIKDGKTMVPLRFVAEGLGAEVDWNADNRIVSIYLD